jgi:excisionase family DNA binding protein
MKNHEEKSRSTEASRQFIAQQLLLTVPETARLLRLSTSKTYTLLSDRCPGGIPIIRFGRSVRIRYADLRRWVERQR